MPSVIGIPIESDRLDAYVPTYAGDSPGFEQFVRSVGPRLRRSAFLLTGDIHLADDLLQTSLAKVAPRWATLAAAGDPTAYVRRVMYTTAAGWRRRRWRGESTTASMPETCHADRLDLVDETLQLRDALAALPMRQRAVLVLRFYEDLTEAQTAEALHCSIGTVKSHTARALARLRTTSLTR